MDERLAVWFGGRRAVCATRHGKEQAMAPLLASHVGIDVFTVPNLDTDQFGTFTREIPRTGSMLDAARAKARYAIAQSGADLAIASEGFFGPHPDIPLAPGNLEIVLLLDQRHGVEIIGQKLTTHVQWVHGVVNNIEDGLRLAYKGGFPDHAMVVRRAEHDPGDMVKGLADEQSFIECVRWLLARTPDHSVFIESDLRAHCNPTRMETICQATLNLIEVMGRFCPRCEAPGFQCIEAVAGLPCRWCGLQTAWPAAHRYRCSRCCHESIKPVAEAFADPGHCAFCNP